MVTTSPTAFVHHLADLDPSALDLLGGKGAGLARMNRLGMPVPPAFVIDTDACRAYRENAGTLPDGLVPAVRAAIGRLETLTGRGFAGSAGLPLLVSVRSGAKVSMPGMMDTVLNLGLTRGSVLRLAEHTGDASFAVDTWVRFWAMFADIVLDCDAEWLKESVAVPRAAAATELTERSAAALEEAIVATLRAEGVQVPVDPHEQLIAAVGAVFSSWDSRRAKAYRAHHGIRDDLGTAVVVQAMVFGNLPGLSGSGVAFTRDPKTGENRLFGEFLTGGQGEEVVAGTRTPLNLAASGVGESAAQWSATFAELERLGRVLEGEYADALDIEFTVETGTLHLLQVRAAKRTAAAAVRTAVDQVDEGLIDVATALRRVSAEQVRKLVAPAFDPAALAVAPVLLTGIGASPGHGVGLAALDADRAAQSAAAGVEVVLVRPTTSPQDLPGMLAAQAVVTARGGATSHAAVVSRALDKPCVTGCETLEVRPEDGVFVVDGVEYPEGTALSVDGMTGNVYAALIPRAVPEHGRGGLVRLLEWADDASGSTVWTAGPAATGPAVISLTDVLLGAGRLEDLLAVVRRLSADPGAVVTADLAAAIRSGLDPLLAAGVGRPIDLRLPLLTSARARRTLDEWASLAPELLDPTGSAPLLDAYLSAIATSAAAAGHSEVTVVVPGTTDPAQIHAFAERAAGAGLLAGAVLQNPAVLARPERLAGTTVPLWVDLAELTRTACGRPAELLFAATGNRLEPLVEDLLQVVAADSTGRRVGVDLSGIGDDEIVRALHGWGFRHFVAGDGQQPALRLLLGRSS